VVSGSGGPRSPRPAGGARWHPQPPGSGRTLRCRPAPATAASADPLPQPLPELLQGYDTTAQITALADWLHAQLGPSSRRVWIATDTDHTDHTARAVLLARLALGGRGLAVAPMLPPPPSSTERRKLLRDVLRLTLWRATGSTGAWLVPEQVARKRNACGL
jgi:hypothetical protein